MWPADTKSVKFFSFLNTPAKRTFVWDWLNSLIPLIEVALSLKRDTPMTDQLGRLLWAPLGKIGIQKTEQNINTVKLPLIPRIWYLMQVNTVCVNDNILTSAFELQFDEEGFHHPVRIKMSFYNLRYQFCRLQPFSLLPTRKCLACRTRLWLRYELPQK